VGANQPAIPAKFVLKSIPLKGRSYGGIALTIKVIGDKVHKAAVIYGGFQVL
jgi:hypothetical protein